MSRTAVAFVAAALALTALAAAQGWQLYAFYLAQDRLPQWDMAGHAWGGIELHQALRHGHPLRFLGLLNAQDKWPFGFSLLLLPFVWAGGDGFAAATLLSTMLFTLVPLLLVWAAWEVDPGAVGWWSGVLASLLFLASPLPRVFAVLIMREEAGVFFSLLAFCAYLRARRLGGEGPWRLAGLAGLALVFIKYNYALIWGVVVAANELLRLSPEKRTEIRQEVMRRLWPWRDRRGFAPRAIAVFLYAVAAGALLGANVGYALYAALLVATVAAARRWRRDPAGVTAWYRGLPAAGRAFVTTVALPLWVWLLSPRPVHPKEILSFLRNRSTGPPLASFDRWLYYPRVLVRDYAPAPLGIAVLVLLALALLCRWSGVRRLAGGEPGRVLLLAAGLSFLLPAFHPYKEPRFLVIAVPFALLSATALLSRLAHSSPHPRAVGAIVCLAAALGILAAARAADLPARLSRDYPMYSSDPVFREPLDAIAGAGREAGRLGVIGSFNELSENLIRCRLAQTGGAAVTRPLSRFSAGLPPAEIAKRLHEWLRDERPGRVVALRPLPGSPLFASEDYRTYNAWQLAAIAALESDPEMRVVARQPFPAAQLEVLSFEAGRPVP